MKKSLFALALIMVFLPITALAIRIQTYNGTVTKIADDKTLTITVDNGVNYPKDQQIVNYTVKPTSGTFERGDEVSFSVNEDVTPPTVVASTVKLGASATANKGVGSTSYEAGDFRLFPRLLCTGDDTLVCWLGAVWQFSQGAILVLAVAAMVIAGVIYMTSAGNPKQIALAKKIIIGALSAVAVMVLGKFFLVNVVGVEWIW